MLMEAKTQDAVLLFEDAVHQLHTTHTGNAIQKVGKANTKRLESNTGRDRLTILGAVDPISLQFSSVTTTGMCNKDLCKLLIDQIVLDHRTAIESQKHIYVVLDNARYQKAYEVLEYAKTHGVTLVFLPPYCPHLNLIERLWKWLKKKVRNRYFPTFQEFSDTIHTLLKNLPTYHDELRTYLNPKFRII